MAPRLSASPRKNKAAAPARSGPAPIGDNSMHGEEAERVQLISIVSQLSAAEDAIEIAKGPLKSAQKKRSQIIGLGKAAGFTAKELQRRLEEMQNGTRENAEQEARERKHRRWLGIVEPDQSALMLGDSAPQEVKDEAHWKGEGYKAGLRLMAAKPPRECGERFCQAWLGEHSRGFTEATAANAPKQMRGVREQAAADFAEDNKPEPGTPEAAAAERKAVRKAKESLEALGARVEENPDAGLEVTEGEKAVATGPRLVVQNATLPAEDPGEVV